MGSGDTGVSSETLLYAALRIELKLSGYPNDPDDLGRCIRMLDRLPWVRERAFVILSSKNSVWSRLINEWDTLVRMYYEELPTRMAPRTYAQMELLIHGTGQLHPIEEETKTSEVKIFKQYVSRWDFHLYCSSCGYYDQGYAHTNDGLYVNCRSEQCSHRIAAE